MVDPRETTKAVLQMVIEAVRAQLKGVQAWALKTQLPGIMKDIDNAGIEERTEMYELLLRIHGKIGGDLGLDTTTPQTREAPRRRAATPSLQRTGQYDPRRKP